MDNNIKSPFANCDAILKNEKRLVTFRNETFEYLFRFYECELTKEHFTTKELDDINISQIHNQYHTINNNIK